MRVKISYKVYPHDRDALPRDPAWHISTRFRNVGTVGTRSRAIRGSTSDGRVGCSASEGRYAPARPALHMRVNISKPCKSLAIDYGFFDHKTAYQRPRTRTTTRTIREAGGSKQESHPVKIPIHMRFTYSFKEMLARVVPRVVPNADPIDRSL